MEGPFYELLNKTLEFSPFIDLSIVNLRYSSHFHKEFELIYVSQGSLELTIDGKTYIMNGGDIGVVMPGEIHSYVTKTSNKVYLIKFVKPLKLESINFLSIKFNRNIIVQGSPFYDKILDNILMIHNEYSLKKLGYQFAVNLHILNIILVFIRDIGCYEISTYGRKRMKERMAMLENVDGYIRDNYNREISLDGLAKHCNYSKYYFSHYFKETTGQSFGEYLAAFRVQKAIELITIKKSKLTDIASMSGFGNIRSFNRYFKKYTGLTPSKYKKEFLDKL